MPLDKKRPWESQQCSSEPTVKNKKLTQLFGLSDSEDDTEEQQEQYDFDLQPTLVMPKTQSSGWDQDDVAVTSMIPMSADATIGTVRQSQNGRMTGNSQFTVIPATPTQESITTVSSGICPESEQFADSATLLLLSYFTDSRGDRGVKRDHTHCDTNVGQGKPKDSTAKKHRTEAQPNQVVMQETRDDPNLIKPLGFSFTSLVVPPERRRRPVSIPSDGQMGVPNFKRFKKVMPEFTTRPSATISFIVHSEFGGMESGRTTSTSDRRRTFQSNPPTPVSFFEMGTPMGGQAEAAFDPSFPERDEFSFDGE